MKVDVHLSNDDETVGLIVPPESMIEDAKTADFSVSLLADMVEMAEDLGWEEITLTLAADHPVFVTVEEADAYLAVTPILEGD